ncbi:MAG: hypothetical protein ACK45X_00365 [Roseiflexaceae bacterium]
MTTPTFHIRTPMEIPQWAIQERQLIATLNDAARAFVARYVRPDGTLIWRDFWPGMDGSDDPYEGFMQLALLYVLGGDDDLLSEARRIWDGITWQWTEYGQVDREFTKYYDWMHHGEGYLYLYFLGLADPSQRKERQRAQRFANMYTGNDPLAPNYDPTHKLMRSPLTGSHGPRHVATAEDWQTHRVVLDHYLAPFEDIINTDFASKRCHWSDDAIYADVITKMNARMNRGDVPLNLNATGLITHAFLYSGDETLHRWICDYIAAWHERSQRNGGIIPDNVGLSDQIGEYLDGKWWGGYYGWRWPHGFMTIIEPITNACMNALLITGDTRWLALAREQLDANWALGQMHDGLFVTPNRHFDAGWSDYRPPLHKYPIYLWYASLADEDLQRVMRIPRQHDWNEIRVGVGKHYINNTLPWFEYIQGRNPDFPSRMLSANLTLVANQLRKMMLPIADPANWHDITGLSQETFNINMHVDPIHAWQELTPVCVEGLLQLTLGAPMHISHGGLQFGQVRYYDAQRRRPGLPPGVAALVSHLDAAAVTLTLVNTDATQVRRVVIQAGTFGEHQFGRVDIVDEHGHAIATHDVHASWYTLDIDPMSGATLVMQMQRYVNRPSYANPWQQPQDGDALIRPREVQ